MQNITDTLSVTLDTSSGGLEKITTDGKMTFCESVGNKWGVPRCDFATAFNRRSAMELTSVDAESLGAAYSNGVIEVKVTRRLENDRLTETFNVTNLTREILFFGEGDLAIYTPFNDSYEAACDCLSGRCHAHLNCCGSDASVLLLRMSDSEHDLGLALLEGSIPSYSVENPPYAKNDRGDILLNVGAFTLEAGETYTLSWVLFPCRDEADFDRIRAEAGQTIISADRYDLYAGESIELFFPAGKNADDTATVNGKNIPLTITDDIAYLSCTADTPGEYRVAIKTDGKCINAVFYAAPDIESLVGARVDFIRRNQQYHRDGSPLDGAYLIYDNDSKSMYYSAFVADHNACRERIGMGLLIIKWLQSHTDAALEHSIREYTEFVLREVVDEQSGFVFDGLGRDPANLRLYNAPWLCGYFCELYALDGNIRWAALAYRIMDAYYQNGGEHFYPNAYDPEMPYNTLVKAGLTNEAVSLLEYSRRHAEVIMQNGTDYPKHEVDYEQTIVAPAATVLLGLYKITGESQYLDAAELHICLLTRFNGHAYDYRVNENSIRHWDDYWFGKQQTFGDTFPHYWSVLSGYVFGVYADATGNAALKQRAENGLRSSLCLFNADGTASCAYVYPAKINNKPGRFFDSYANDQDFALYYIMQNA